MNIGHYTFEAFIEIVRRFHGSPAPGVVLGAYMVEYAKSLLPDGLMFDAVVETDKCLPDAVQLLTVLSIGNRWLKILNVGRYALALYDKQNGTGWRVFIDSEKLGRWPRIEAWLRKLEPKDTQNNEALFEEIQHAGHRVCSCHPVQLQEEYLAQPPKSAIGQCPLCNELYPLDHGPYCRGCLGGMPYVWIEPNDRERRQEFQFGTFA